MKIIRYGKLVRDNIPSIIEKEGKRAKVRFLEKSERGQALKNKLLEEAQELFDANTMDEIGKESADILEVILAIIEANGLRLDEVEAIRKKRSDVRGSFKSWVFLEEVYEEDESSSEKHPE